MVRYLRGCFLIKYLSSLPMYFITLQIQTANTPKQMFSEHSFSKGIIAKNIFPQDVSDNYLLLCHMC